MAYCEENMPYILHIKHCEQHTREYDYREYLTCTSIIIVTHSNVNSFTK